MTYHVEEEEEKEEREREREKKKKWEKKEEWVIEENAFESFVSKFEKVESS